MLAAIAAKLDAQQWKIEDLHDELMGFKSTDEASMDATAEIIGDYLGANSPGEVRPTSTATYGTQTVEPSQSDGETSSPSWRDVLLRPCSVPVHAGMHTAGTPCTAPGRHTHGQRVHGIHRLFLWKYGQEG